MTRAGATAVGGSGGRRSEHRRFPGRSRATVAGV